MSLLLKPGKLNDVHLKEKSAWITYKNEDNEFKINSVSFDAINSGSYDLIMDDRDEKDDEMTFSKNVDHKEAYLKTIFEPYRFSKLTICKALSVRDCFIDW